MSCGDSVLALDSVGDIVEFVDDCERSFPTRFQEALGCQVEQYEHLVTYLVLNACMALIVVAFVDILFFEFEVNELAVHRSQFVL